MPVDKSDDSDLQILRNLPCDEVLPLICTFIKADRDYKPLKNQSSELKQKATTSAVFLSHVFMRLGSGFARFC
jgi:hypothetical protein